MRLGTSPSSLSYCSSALESSQSYKSYVSELAQKMYLTSFPLYSKGRICEGSDMRGSDMRGSTVYICVCVCVCSFAIWC